MTLNPSRWAPTFVVVMLIGLASTETAAGEDAVAPIVVTARRTEEPLADVPASVTVIPGTALDDAGANSFARAAAFAPNFQVIEYGSRRNTQIHMRGVGSSRSADSAVGLYVDDVPYLHYGGFDNLLFDIDRIEVLRGPQGALYGRNTMAGVVNVVTRPPAERASAATIEYGSADSRLVRATHRGPLGGGWAAGITGLWTVGDGFTKNDFLGGTVDERKSSAGRGTLAWARGDWAVSLAGDIQADRDGGFPFADLADVRSRPHHANLDDNGFQDRDLGGASLSVKRRGGAVNVTSVTAWRDWSYDAAADVDFTQWLASIGSFRERQSQVTEELRVSSANGARGPAWQAGAFYFKDITREDTGTAFAGVTIPPDSSSKITTTGTALFGQVSHEFMPRWTVAAGARWDHERKDSDMLGTDAMASPFALADRRDFDQISPRASVSWQPRETLLAFAGASRGFKSGGFNSQATSAADARYDPEYTWNFEIGARAECLDRRCTVGASVFHILWKDQQVIEFVPPVRSVLKNAAESESTGFEVEAALRPARGWKFSAGIGLADARFTAGATDGKDLSVAPRWNGNLAAGYEGPLAGKTRWFSRAEAQGTSGFYWDTANTLWEDPHAVVNIRAGITHGVVRVEAWVRNLLDTDYAVVAFPTGQLAPVPSVVGQAGDPLTVGVGVTAGF
ncbi:MAG: TonB-dependent receptor [Planctomycetota bacterium]